MPLLPLLPIFHNFNKEYFDGSLTAGTVPIVSIRWSDGRLRKTAGYYRRGAKVKSLNCAEIVLSKPILERLPVNAIKGTLCHEMIHAWIDLVLNQKEGHGSLFHSRMNLINSSQVDFQVTVRHKFPVPAISPKWLAICPSCKSRSPYQRLVRGAACRHCCNTYHGGLWHPSCLLIYEPVLKEN